MLGFCLLVCLKPPGTLLCADSARGPPSISPITGLNGYSVTGKWSRTTTGRSMYNTVSGRYLMDGDEDYYY
ncbi:hypothetical protein M752DRAFT_275744 [Aspergillus phoenicis ATCC 13157]|nr:hypothetical protein M752DRAFT_275744 [Aspergillus phoenicis ATCC 13157]